MPAMESKSSGSVRAIGRALTILQIINRYRSLSMMDIAKHANLPYPTVFRIVETLIEAGVIEQERGRKHYRPTQEIRSLSSGYQPEDRLADVARPYLVKLTRQVTWPITLCTRVGLTMMIRDSTYAITPLALSLYHPGYTFPILDSSSGRAYLAFCPPEEYVGIMRALEQASAGSTLQSRAAIEALLAEIRDRGFSTHDRTLATSEPGKNSSISAPVFECGVLVGTVTLIFFASAKPLDRAIDQYAETLVRTSCQISEELSGAPGMRTR
jgi:IclR family mhp operon transcriptional activator